MKLFWILPIFKDQSKIYYLATNPDNVTFAKKQKAEKSHSNLRRKDDFAYSISSYLLASHLLWNLRFIYEKLS